MSLVTPRRYDQAGDVSMRLRNTVVRYKGKPVFVSGLTGEESLSIQGWFLDGSGSFSCHSSDVDLDISNIEIGWVNLPKSCHYIMRSPKRSQKQGVVPQNCLVLSLSQGSSVGHGIYFESSDEWQALGKAIDRIYPTFEKAVAFASDFDPRRKGRPSMAFSQDWAVVGRNGFLGVFHKTVPVAIYYPDKRKFLFKKGALTKTRHATLNQALYKATTGASYAIVELS